MNDMHDEAQDKVIDLFGALKQALDSMPYRIWRSETDRFSARTCREATRMRDELYGWEPDGEESNQYPFDRAPMSDDELLHVTFQDGCPDKGKDLDYPPWVDAEPDAHIEYELGKARVVAPASVWAKHERGMVGSTEY